MMLITLKCSFMLIKYVFNLHNKTLKQDTNIDVSRVGDKVHIFFISIMLIFVSKSYV